MITKFSKAVFVSALFFTPFHARALDLCEQIYSKPKVELKIDKGKVIYNHKKTGKEIKNIFVSKGGVDAGLSYHTGGLTSANFITSTNIGIKTAFTPHGEGCVVMSDITYSIGYKELVVYVDKKYSKHSCEYDVVLKHENMHVKIFQTSLDYYSKYFADALNKAVSYIRPVSIKNEQDINVVLAAINKKINKEMAPMMNFYNQARDTQNQKLDTKENYEYTQSLCKNW